MITPRVARLRRQSLDAIPTLSAERAVLISEAYRLHDGLLSAPMRRALAFRYVMERRTITIGDGALIVGEKGPTPKATPTYPELCCHTRADPDILDSREKIRFRVSPETRAINAEQIIGRLVTIARGLAQQSDVLLLDEPDAYLDPKNQHLVQETIAC